MTILNRFIRLNWGIVITVMAIFGIGVGMLYSAAGGDFDPWASRQVGRFAFCFVVMLFVALVDIRVWLRMAWPIYFLALGLIVSLPFIGVERGGAVRWIDLQFLLFQPSEAMQVAIIVALAAYYNRLSNSEVGKITKLIIPALVIVVPAYFIIKQPDLGTTLKLLMISAAVLFVAGVRVWKFLVVGTTGLLSSLVVWNYLKDYQKDRIMTFINPERDPLGTGYNIIQSKIAIGSGGIFGKGYMKGTQIQNGFLPENHTDFVFSLIAEEWGLLGATVIIGLYVLLILQCLSVAFSAESQYGRLVVLGVTVNLFLYVFINMGMVMGIMPVVGLPLPLVSYGGTVMLIVMISIGLVMNVHINRQAKLRFYKDE